MFLAQKVITIQNQNQTMLKEYLKVATVSQKPLIIILAKLFPFFCPKLIAAFR